VIIETFPVGPFECNCTILGDEQSREAIVIDPGDDAPMILERLAKHGLTPKQIVCTHSHIDHVGAIGEMQGRFSMPASIHQADLFLYENLEIQAQLTGLPIPKRGIVDQFVKDGDTVTSRGVELGVIHTPGHTPGSICFQLGGNQPMLFAGDTLFARSIGRTDLWGGSYEEIMKSIHQRLMTLKDDTIVIAGHGESTTIGHERRYNPFLQ
jgi:glyoxylase-like metal-dependent hydrolase (beta-lactamase superfamily II)